VSPFRESEAPVIPDHLWEPKWHQKLRCRAIGHSWQELFEPKDGQPFPAYCSRCSRTRPEGRSHADYYTAVVRYKEWIDRMVTAYG
jgi:hypothetical protein